MNSLAEQAFSVSEFVALTNQILEYALNGVTITGELANFRVSKGKWVYFDLKDEVACVNFFGTVYNLPGPLEDGMLLRVKATPRLHPKYGFSLNIISVHLAGEGSIKKAAKLLEAKLAKEGLFAPERKRILPYPPQSVGLITSSESAAYHDFIKIVNARWRGLTITLADILVQGDSTVGQIISAVNTFNQMAEPPEVLILTRGGGSAEDLAVFSDEKVVRAIAASRIPTLVAVGHEVDISLAELAADVRASTPSNAAEILVPDRQEIQRQLKVNVRQLTELTLRNLKSNSEKLTLTRAQLMELAVRNLEAGKIQLAAKSRLLAALDPGLPLTRGYALVRNEAGKLIRRGSEAAKNATINIEVSDAFLKSKVEEVNGKN